MRTSFLAVATALATWAGGAAAQDRSPLRTDAAEIAVGVLAHGERPPFRSAPPPEFDLYEGEEERGTVDVQLVYRTAPVRWALRPRFNARLQVNTGGRTSFAAVGAEWRQHVLRDRVYGQIGIGVAVHDGYRFTPDPFAAGLSLEERNRRVDLFNTRTSFGSRVLFNPNLSVGVRLTDRWAVEAAWEHFSHANLFSRQNPGIENFGIRLVHAFGR